jgi:hypothetical protein
LFVTSWVTHIHGIITRVGESVGSDAFLGDLKPVGLDEQRQLGIVVAGIEVLQPGVGIVAVALPL